MSKRADLAKRYCVGEGLEIGAFHSPWPVPKGLTVKHIDSRSQDQLKNWAKVDKCIPKASISRIPKIDFLAKAETCEGVADSSFTFVLASHVLEHCFDPIAALKNWLRVLKTDGVIVLAVPVASQCFDKDRPLTSLKQMQLIFEGDEEFRKSERKRLIFESLSLVDKLVEPQLTNAAEQILESGEDIHFNVWEHHSFEYQIATMRSLKIEGLQYSILECFTTGHECFAVLRKVQK